MSRPLPVIPFPTDTPDDLIQQAMKDRGINPAVYDFIKHNLGKGAAVAAILVGTPQVHDHVPGEACRC